MKKMAWTGSYRLQNFPDYPSLLWDSLSPWWELEPCLLWQHLIDLADFPAGLKGIDQVLHRGWNCLWRSRLDRGRLKKFEIPLAMPVIMSGIPDGGGLIGTATLAAWRLSARTGFALSFERWPADLFTEWATLFCRYHCFNSTKKWWKKQEYGRFFSGFALVTILLGLWVSLLVQKEKENLVIAQNGPERKFWPSYYAVAD